MVGFKVVARQSSWTKFSRFLVYTTSHLQSVILCMSDDKVFLRPDNESLLVIQSG